MSMSTDTSTSSAVEEGKSVCLKLGMVPGQSLEICRGFKTIAIWVDAICIKSIHCTFSVLERMARVVIGRLCYGSGVSPESCWSWGMVPGGRTSKDPDPSSSSRTTRAVSTFYDTGLYDTTLAM